MADENDAIQLADLNVEIGRREAQADVAWFRDLLASQFVMRRANPDRDSVGRDAFLEALSHAAPKERETRIESVVLVGTERAIVTCIGKSGFGRTPAIASPSGDGARAPRAGGSAVKYPLRVCTSTSSRFTLTSRR